jgi:Concanavalin A-like lectin/glucanases superfamily
MLELICQQRYREQGVPVDLSQYHNHGSAWDAPASGGMNPGQTAISFPHPNSCVAIAPGAGQWAPLIALRIEIAAKIVDPFAARTMTLVEGAGAFRFGIMEKALEAGFFAPPGVKDTYVRSDSTYSPDGAFHQVPPNRWVKLGFDHDGYSRMRLLIDGHVIGERIVSAAVPPVQTAGVSIGNTIGGGTPLVGGVIDEVAIWRLDPKGIKREFLCRPYDESTAQCWAAIFRAVREWGEAHPAELVAVLSALSAQSRAAIRTLFLLPEAEQAEIRAILHEYEHLWCSGRIDGGEMRAVLARWVAALRRHGVDTGAGADLKDLRRRLSIDDKKLSLECDPAARRFLQLFEQALNAS